MTTTKVLQNQAGIQFQGVKDKSEANPTEALVVALIAGKFKRGRLDKPFKITKENVRAKLGYDPQNPDYVAIEDALTDGAPFIYVQRVASDVSNACTLSLELVHDSFIPDNGQQYGVLVYSGGETDNFYDLYPDSYDFVEGSYIDVGALVNSLKSRIYEIDNSTAHRENPHTSLNLECKVFETNYPIYVDNLNRTWDQLVAGTISINYKEETYYLDYGSGSFTYTGDMYTYVLSLFAKITAKLESIGLSATVLTDTSYQGSTSTSFSPKMFPHLDIRAPDGDLNTFSINLNNPHNWVFSGRKQYGDCVQQYSIDDFPSEMTTEFVSFVPGAKEYPDDEDPIELEDKTSNPFKVKLIPGPLPGGRINVLDLVKNHDGAIELKYCWTLPNTNSEPM